MIKNGLVAYHEDGAPYFVTPFENIQKYFLKKEEKGLKQIAEKAIVETMQNETRDQTVLSVQQYFVLGRAVWQGISQWAARRGMTAEELLKMPAHKIVLESLEQAEKVPGLENENKDLRNQLAVLLDETDPIIRLKKAIQLLNKFLAAAIIAEEIGLNIESIIPTYEHLIKGYITGAPNA